MEVGDVAQPDFGCRHIVLVPCAHRHVGLGCYRGAIYTPLICCWGGIDPAGECWGVAVEGFIGALIIIRPGYVPFNPLIIGILISAMSNASVQLITKHVALNISGAVLIFYMNLALVPFALILAIPDWIWPSWDQLGWILAVGAFGTLGHIFLARGMKVADASLLAPVDFMRLPIASAFGWILFGEYSDIETWIDAAFIFVAVMIITRREARRAAENRE